jgi:hypothetical protein
MANILRTSLLLCFFVIVFYGGKSQASTAANVYDVTDYGASTKKWQQQRCEFAHYDQCIPLRSQLDTHGG